MFRPAPVAEIIRPIAGSKGYYSKGSFGTIQIQEVAVPIFKLHHIVIVPEKDITVEVKSAYPLLGAVISLRNTFRFTDITDLPDLEIPENRYNILYAPSLDDKMVFKKDGEYHLLIIHFSEKYVKKYFTFFPALNLFAGEVVQNNHAALTQGSFSIPKETSQLLHRLFDQAALPAKRELPFLYTNLVNDIMYQLLKQAAHPEPEQDSHTIKLHKAKDFAENNYRREYTIPQIASEIGMSVSGLKSGFKVYFGKGILEWMEDKRIAEAKEMLKKTEMRINEMAAALGYKRSSSFTAAFKKKTGMSPTKWRDSKSSKG